MSIAPLSQQSTKSRILEAAKNLLSASAPTDGLTLRAVIAAAGISRATFYHHFQGKPALLLALAAEGYRLNNGPAGRRSEILDAALQLVASQGYHETTVAQIAETAGLSKGGVYWYFKDKNELFQSAIRRLAPLLNLLPSLESRLDEPPEVVLPFFARTHLANFERPEVLHFFRILISEAPHIPEVGQYFGQNVKPLLDFLTRYIRHQIDLGRFRPHDPQSSSRAFIGALMVFVFSALLFPVLHAGLPDQDSYITEVVAVFIRGLGMPGKTGTT